MIDGSEKMLARVFIRESRIKLVVANTFWGFFYHDVIYKISVNSYKYFKCDKNYIHIQNI